MLVVPLNARAPTTFTLRILSPLFGPDLSTVSLVTAGLLRRDGSSTSVTFTIVSQTTKELVAQYTIAGGEFTTTGAHYLAPQLTLSSGVVPTETVPIYVGGPYNCTPQLSQDAWVIVTVPIPSLGPGSATHGWKSLQASQSPYSCSPLSPWVALDLTTGAISAELWPARDGDSVVFCDVKNAASSHNFTLNAGADQSVPQGDGTYDDSVVYSNAGFTVRLKFRAVDGLWIPW